MTCPWCGRGNMREALDTQCKSCFTFVPVLAEVACADPRAPYSLSMFPYGGGRQALPTRPDQDELNPFTDYARTREDHR